LAFGSNLGEFTLNFLFAKISFGLNVKGQGNPRSQEGLENTWSNGF